MVYDGTGYYFHRNIQGDVVGVYNSAGTKVVGFTYDAYGNCTVSGDTSLAYRCKIRYRGYYFDAETGFYWVQTRYYNPEWCRWISPDSLSYLDPETAHGLNLYAYCGNDPVNLYDPTGHSWESFWQDVGNWFEEHWEEVLVGTLFILGGAIVTACTAGAGTSAWAAFGAALASSIGQVGLGIGTAVVVNGIQNVANGNQFFDNVGDTIASSYMLSGILSGGSQILSGGFRLLRAKAGYKGIDSKYFGFMSPDKLYYDNPGMTVIRMGTRKGAKFALDFGKYGIHAHIWKWSAHIPLIPGIVGICELF
ncbi:MAG: RHS repeat-associated core domain-containing protein, partial [Clostridia bacterium]|nr:RHS repeat-associated core domain-containing protein [Clostridia bacterium]